MSSKVCNSCDRSLPHSAFNKKSAAKDGLQTNCRECAAAKTAAWVKADRKRNPDKWKAKDAAVYQRHADDQRDRAKQRYQRLKHDPEFVAKRYAYGAKRRELLRQATFGDKQAIDYVYYAAQVIKQVYGGTPDVDHIIPAQGENVCGLHAGWNLQLMNPTENKRKSNRQ